MALSPISGITVEGTPRELASFVRAGVPYVLWSAPLAAMGKARLSWKPHGAANFTEVQGALLTAYRRISAILDPSTDQLLVVWDDGLAEDGFESGKMFGARFNVATGALVSGPTDLGEGSEPRLSYVTATPDDRLLLYYRTAKNLGVYGRRSEDGGATWSSAYPLLTGKVSQTSRLKVIPYDGQHVSIAQVGVEARRLPEIGMFQRTRPLSNIVAHPTDATKLFVSEPSKSSDSITPDNIRGGLVVSVDQTRLYHLGGIAQGTTDAINAVARLTVSGTTLTVDASAGPVGNGDNLVEYTLAPAVQQDFELPGITSDAVACDVSATHGYVALRHAGSNVGELDVVDLSTASSSAFLTGIQSASAVAVANFLSPPLIFAGTTESGVHRLRVYAEDALTPTLFMNVKLPARPLGITVRAHPTEAGGVRLYVSMTDRIAVYDYFNSTHPILMVDTILLTNVVAGAEAQKMFVTANGTMLVPAGRGGVLVFSPDGRLAAQTFLSGKIVQPWTPSTAYAFDALVRPRDTHPFAAARYYFRASTAGTTGSGEPAWASTGTMSDGTAVWTPVALTDGVAASIAFNEQTKRLYVAGTAGGPNGTDGRVWILDGSKVL